MRIGITRGSSLNLKHCAGCAGSAIVCNRAVVRMLGLCPLLAVSQTCGQAFTCGVLFALIVCSCGVGAGMLRHFVSWRLRPLYHALLAASVTAGILALAELIAYDAVAALGIYPALIAGNCFVLSHIQETAERRPLAATLVRGARDVGGIVSFLVVFGALREMLAYGQVFGAASAARDGVLPIFASPPGALLLLALAAAAANRSGLRQVNGRPVGVRADGTGGAPLATAGPTGS